MLCSAPRLTTIMKGNPSQVFVITFAVNEVQNSLNQATGVTPKRPSRWFTMPYCWLNMPFQTRAVM